MKHWNRRELLHGVAAASLGAKFAGAFPQVKADDFSLFWGDLHNHNAVGYARGSLERSYDIARCHLDFVAFTPHAQWHDIPTLPGNVQESWAKGLQVTKEQWPRVQKMAADNNEPGKFVSFLAFEWHSSAYGDYCVYFPEDDRPLLPLDGVRKLQQFARDMKATIIPHHISYKVGARGANFDFFDPTVSPVMEIYSEHGLSERDRGPYDYLSHSGGGRWTQNTVQFALGRGIRAGFIASSDDHLGFPGAYGQGLVGVYARNLSRKAILEAIWARRTFAVTGDRIAVSFRLNDKWMGSTVPFAPARNLEIAVAGQDEIEQIEVIKNGRVIHRHFPGDHVQVAAAWPGSAACRLEYGWGPWGGLNIVRICDWDLMAKLHGGKITAAVPCFQSGPLDEKRRHSLSQLAENACRLRSYTSRKDAFRQRPTNSVVLHLTGAPSAVLEVSFSSPVALTMKKTLGELMQKNEVGFTGPYTSESFIIHRLVPPALLHSSFGLSDTGKRGQTDWYYVRVTQVNGQMAWSSPIWVEG